MIATVDTLSQSLLFRIVAFILLGASGTYLLLPHGHGVAKPITAHRVGYALMTIAVVIFASFWTL